MAKEKKGVRLEHISKIYQDPKTKKNFYAVKDTTLDIEPGSFVTLLGPSGCGKTTTLRMIAGFESPDEGEIYLGGEPDRAPRDAHGDPDPERGQREGAAEEDGRALEGASGDGRKDPGAELDIGVIVILQR